MGSMFLTKYQSNRIASMKSWLKFIYELYVQKVWISSNKYNEWLLKRSTLLLFEPLSDNVPTGTPYKKVHAVRAVSAPHIYFYVNQ